MHVQEVSMLHERPAWLHTIPCLVHTETKKGYRDDAIQTFVSSYPLPSYLRPKVASNHKTKAKRQQDRHNAESEVFDERLAPLHVKSTQAQSFQ